MFKWWMTAVLGSTLVLAACNTLPMGTDNPHQSSRQQPDQSLHNTAWQLSQLNGKAVQVDATESNQPHLRFSSDLRVSGATGCNHLMGQAEVNGKQLKFGQFGMTKMFCHGDRFEIPFVAALNKTRAYQITDNQLTLTDAMGRVVAVLTASNLPAE